MILLRVPLLLLLLLLCYPLATLSSTEGEEPLPLQTKASLFQAIETWDYPSGLRVYFKSAAQSPNVYIAATLPVGSRHDPIGREGLAHLVEHLLFTDHGGKTEAEIKQSVLDRGGRSNATTSRYMTRYHVDLPSSEWPFAIEWMHDLLRGHQFQPAQVEAERKVVMLEKSYRQPGSWPPLDQLQEWLWSKGLLVKQDFWQREFGLRPEYRGVLGSRASVRAIDVEDVQAFYDRYYGPQNVSIMIVGDIAAEQAKALLDRSFGTWQAKEERISAVLEPASTVSAKQRVAFKAVANVHLRHVYKLFFPSGYDMEMAQFSARFLQHALNQQLRGEYKATYGVRVNVESFGGHALLSIAGHYAEEDMPVVAELIESTLDNIRQDRITPGEFERIRGRILSDLTTGSQTAKSLADWCTLDGICNQDVYRELPNRFELWKELSTQELAQWFSQNLTVGQRLLEITKPLPWPWLWLEFMGPLCGMALVVFALRRRWSTPADMTRIRYLCSLRYSWPLLVFAVAAITLLSATIAIPGYWIVERILVFSSSLDSYFLHIFLRSCAWASALTVILAIGAIVPRQIQLFSDGWRIQFFWRRTLSYRYEDIQEAHLCSLWNLILNGRLFHTLPLHWSFGKGLYLRFGSQRACFIGVDNAPELLSQMTALGKLPHMDESFTTILPGFKPPVAG